MRARIAHLHGKTTPKGSSQERKESNKEGCAKKEKGLPPPKVILAFWLGSHPWLHGSIPLAPLNMAGFCVLELARESASDCQLKILSLSKDLELARESAERLPAQDPEFIEGFP